MTTATPAETTTTANPRLKTLYLTGHGTTLAKKQQRFIIKKDNETLQDIPTIHVNQILIFGNIQLTTQVMQHCLKHNIPIHFHTQSGSYYGVLDNFDTQPIELQRQQYRKAEDPTFCRRLARELIRGKLANSRLILKRLARRQQAHPKQHQQLQQAAQDINAYQRQLNHAQTLDQIRGIEGISARTYFQTLAATLPPAWNFHGRNKRPAQDPINALLSYGYTLLFHNTYSFIKSTGLNPHIGFLHPPRRGHPALASDLMEEFRAVIIDSVILDLVHNQKLTPDDFEHPEPGSHNACRIRTHARKTYIQHIETKLNSPITHPVSGYKIDYRRCIEHQTQHLASLIRIDPDDLFNQHPDNTYQSAIFR